MGKHGVFALKYRGFRAISESWVTLGDEAISSGPMQRWWQLGGSAAGVVFFNYLAAQEMPPAIMKQRLPAN